MRGSSKLKPTEEYQTSAGISNKELNTYDGKNMDKWMDWSRVGSVGINTKNAEGDKQNGR